MADSQKMDILREHKEALTLAMEKVQSIEKVAGSLFSGKIISDEDFKKFASLDPDPDHLNPTLKARYLLHVAFTNIEKKVSLLSTEKGSSLIIKFLEILQRYDEMKGICYYLLKEIKENESDEVSKEKDFVLVEEHVNILAEVLHNVSHKWEQLGIMLQLCQADIAEIAKFSSDKCKLYYILLRWYNKKRFVSLDILKNALQSGLVSETATSETFLNDFREKVLTMESPAERFKMDRLQVDGLSDCQVSDGKSTILEVQSNESDKFQWYKGNKSLCDNGRYSGVSSNMLFIKHACQGIEGKYSCSINGNIRATAKKTLTVIFSPEKKNLLDIYSRKPEISKDLWPPVGNSTFITLALINEDRTINKILDDSVRGDVDDILREKIVGEYELYFQKYEDGALVLVEGRPGSGKSTLTRKLSKDWATTPDILTGANFVFLISLRILTASRDITFSLILEPFYSSADMRDKLVFKIEKENGRGCCFIVDGLDEYKHRDNEDDCIHRLVHKKYLPNAMIIVASRPVGSVNLRCDGDIIVSKRIEVLGFSRKSIFSYIDSYYSPDVQTAKKLKDYLLSHVNLLHMCYLPVHAAMICFIY